jgi:hypothetical protein
LPILAIIGKLSWRNNPPNNRHIIAKIIYKIILFHQKSIRIFAPMRQLRGCRIIAGLQDHCGAAGSLRGCRIIAGLQEHGGVRGEARFPPLEPGKQIIKQYH